MIIDSNKIETWQLGHVWKLLNNPGAGITINKELSDEINELNVVPRDGEFHLDKATAFGLKKLKNNIGENNVVVGGNTYETGQTEMSEYFDHEISFVKSGGKITWYDTDNVDNPSTKQVDSLEKLAFFQGEQHDDLELKVGWPIQATIISVARP